MIADASSCRQSVILFFSYKYFTRISLLTFKISHAKCSLNIKKIRNVLSLKSADEVIWQRQAVDAFFVFVFLLGM